MLAQAQGSSEQAGYSILLPFIPLHLHSPLETGVLEKNLSNEGGQSKTQNHLLPSTTCTWGCPWITRGSISRIVRRVGAGCILHQLQDWLRPLSFPKLLSLVQVNSLTRRGHIFRHLNKLRLGEGVEKVWGKGWERRVATDWCLQIRGESEFLTTDRVFLIHPYAEICPCPAGPPCPNRLRETWCILWGPWNGSLSVWIMVFPSALREEIL